jgi:hypothetical protein
VTPPIYLACEECAFFYGDIRLYPDLPLKCPDCGSDQGLAFADLEYALAWVAANKEPA